MKYIIPLLPIITAFAVAFMLFSGDLTQLTTAELVWLYALQFAISFFGGFLSFSLHTLLND